MQSVMYFRSSLLSFRVERSNNRKTSAIAGDERYLELAIALNHWRFKNNGVNKKINDRLASFGNCTSFL